MAHQKVIAGDPLNIPARTYNAFVELANRAEGTLPIFGSTAGQGPAAAVSVQNNSGADVARFGVLGVDSPIFSPTASLVAFQEGIAINGVTPSSASHLGKFVVLLEPLANGKVGSACAAGLVPVQVNVANATDGFADVTGGDTSKLTSGTSGAAQILWKAGGTGTQWAIVRLANPAPAASSGGLPIGVIVMWSGTQIPTGWALCDGGTYNTKTTPDLRGRFIYGSNPGAGLNIGATGGATTHTHAAHVINDHQHHGHDIGTNPDQAVERWQGNTPEPVTTWVSGPKTGYEQIPVQGNPGQWADTTLVHTGALDHAATNHLPPYYVLAFIMYVGTCVR